VNVITKEPKRNTFMAEARNGYTGIGGHQGGGASADYQINVNGSMVTDDKRTGGYIYGMLRDRDPFDQNGDGFSEAVLIENSTLGFGIFHKPGIRSKLSLDAYRIKDFRRGGNQFNKLPHETDITEQVDHLVTGANLSYDLFTNDDYDKLSLYISAQTVDRDSYYGAMKDPGAYGLTSDITGIAGAQYIINLDNFIFSSSTSVVGIENTINALEDIKLGANGDNNTILSDQLVNTVGSFLQHDWKSSFFNLSLGLRYDYVMIKDFQDHEENHEDFTTGIIIPRIGTLIKFTPDTRLRLGYAKGYRAPQIFNEDLHIELVNAKRVRHFNSEDLSKEISHAFTTSFNTNFRLGKTANEFLIEGFYTYLRNPFADEFFPLNDEGDFAYQRVNAEDGAFVTGINIELNSHINDKTNFQAGFTIQKSRYESPQAWGEGEDAVSKNFMRTPDLYGYATLLMEFSDAFSSSVSLSYTGAMDVPHFGLMAEDFEGTDEYEAVVKAIENGDVIEGERLERSADFLILDFLLNYDFKLGKESKLRLFGGVKNAFNQTQASLDRGIYRDAGYIYGPSMPRTLNFGLKIGNF